MATEVKRYPWLDVAGTLSSDLGRCLNGQFPSNGAVWWEGEWAALQNEGQLVSAVDPSADPVRVLEAGFSLPTQTWIDWFNASAADVASG
jgi:hypothetical protein